MPPRPATWLVDLFAPPSQADAILGDLLEEFTSIAVTSGQRAARRWYWRQAIKTQGHLLLIQARHAPWLLAAVALVGSYLPGIYGNGIKQIVDALHAHWQVYAYIDAYSFWLIYWGLAGHLLVPMFAGWLVASLMRNRSMAAALVLAFSGALYPALRFTWTALRDWPAHPFLGLVMRNSLVESWILASVAFMAILVGGGIARKCSPFERIRLKHA